MNGFILGFQRFVWWPKWTPASIISRIVSGVSSEGWKDSFGAAVVVSVDISFLFRVGFRRRRPRGSSPPPPELAPDSAARVVLSFGVWCLRGQVFTTFSTPCCAKDAESLELSPGWSSVCHRRVNCLKRRPRLLRAGAGPHAGCIPFHSRFRSPKENHATHEVRFPRRYPPGQGQARHPHARNGRGRDHLHGGRRGGSPRDSRSRSAR